MRPPSVPFHETKDAIVQNVSRKKGVVHTKTRYDDYFCSGSDEFSKSFGESEIPANQHTQRSKRCVNDFVGLMGT